MSTLALDSATTRQQQPVRTVARLVAVDLRLLAREPMSLVGLLGVPIVVMLVIAGVFGQTPDPEFGGVAPHEYYVASYVGVVLASLGLVTLPVHIATNRELGVTRRFRASGLTAGTLVASQIGYGVVAGLASSAIVLGIGWAVYGIAMPIDSWGVAAWFALGLLCYLAVGSALGLLVRTGRAANAIGSLLFLPTFLLGGGGPPRAVMGDAMQRVADIIPLSHITAGMRREWLGADGGTIVLWWPVIVTMAAIATAVWVARRRAE